MGKIYQVYVNGLRGEKMLIDLCNTEEQMKSMTVRQLKEKILPKLPKNAKPDHIRLIFTDKPLEEDSNLLCDYGIKHLSLIQVVVKLHGGGGFPEKGDGGIGDKDKSQKPDHIRLIFTDKPLEEDSTLLCDYGIQRLPVIHMVRLPGGGGFPEKGDGGIGDKDKSQSMEKLSDL